jgi:hypothetical protein
MNGRLVSFTDAQALLVVEGSDVPSAWAHCQIAGTLPITLSASANLHDALFNTNEINMATGGWSFLGTLSVK